MHEVRKLFIPLHRHLFLPQRSQLPANAARRHPGYAYGESLLSISAIPENIYQSCIVTQSILSSKLTDKVFMGQRNCMTQKPLKDWLDASGITKHISYHCSRHTFGSLQADAGTSIYVIQRILGHKNVETTQIYADMSDETKRQSVDRITLKPKVQPLSVVKPTGTE